MTQFFKEIDSVFDGAAAAYRERQVGAEAERRCDGCGEAMYFNTISYRHGSKTVCAACRARFEEVRAHAV